MRGSPKVKPRGGPNETTVDGDTTVIHMRRKNGDVFNCYVDTADYPLVREFRWKISFRKGKATYASNTGSKQHIHTCITGCLETDHIDRDGLNNRRNNLRPCTRSQNLGNVALRSTNTTGYKGVSIRSDGNGFVAQITPRGYLGSFQIAEDAARAYDKAAKEHFGEFAWLNFPDTEAAHAGQ